MGRDYYDYPDDGVNPSTVVFVVLGICFTIFFVVFCCCLCEILPGDFHTRCNNRQGGIFITSLRQEDPNPAIYRSFVMRGLHIKHGKRRKRDGFVRTVESPVAVVVSSSQTVVSGPPQNQQFSPQQDASGSYYIVPFSALPQNFDYSSPYVEVRSDHVILRDLSMLNAQNNAYPQVPPPYTEAYQKQSPYNPGYPQ